MGPLLFLLYVNDIPSYVSSKVRLFADDAILYRKVDSATDASSLQKDLDALCRWESDWEMKFNSDKCFVMHMTTKREPRITTYNINHQALHTTKSHPYLGLILSSDCSWSSHINKITTSAKQTVGVIRRNFKSCSTKVKSHLYQSLARPKLEYGVCGWAPSTIEECKQLEAIQRYAARMCCNNYTRTASVTDMLNKLQWPLLEKRRTITRLIMLFKIHNGLVEVQNNLKTKSQSRTLRGSHQFAFHRPHAQKNFYKNSFYPSTIPHWNSLPDSTRQSSQIKSIQKCRRRPHPRGEEPKHKISYLAPAQPPKL